MREGIAGPLSSPRQRIFEFILLSLRRMSGLQQFIFKTHLHLAFALMSLDTIWNLSAVQISGLPGYDRPLTHTVTLRLARSSKLLRWRHSISSS